MQYAQSSNWIGSMLKKKPQGSSPNSSFNHFAYEPCSPPALMFFYYIVVSQHKVDHDFCHRIVDWEVPQKLFMKFFCNVQWYVSCKQNKCIELRERRENMKKIWVENKICIPISCQYGCLLITVWIFCLIFPLAAKMLVKNSFSLQPKGK